MSKFKCQIKSKTILRQAQDNLLIKMADEIMVSLRRELSRTLVEPWNLKFGIPLTFEIKKTVSRGLN